MTHKFLLPGMAVWVLTFSAAAFESFGQAKAVKTEGTDGPNVTVEAKATTTGDPAGLTPEKSPDPQAEQATENETDSASNAAAKETLRRLLRQLLFSDKLPKSRPDGSDHQDAATRDPFSTTPRMRERALEIAPRLATATAQIPKLELRGLLDNGDQEPLALLEAEGMGVVLVREQDTISVQIGRAEVVVIVQSITGNGVAVEIETLGKTLMLR